MPNADVKTMEGQLELSQHNLEQTFEVNINGRLVFSDNSQFRELVDRFRDHGGKDLVVDLSGLDFIDSAGLGMLLVAKEAADKNKMAMTVRGARGQVKEMFDISRFDAVISIQD